ncbi:MAG TPA: cupin domain-containing protein [Thermomicrobiales bacterium]|nr:cupin domain-containing protein [Thermomicrobiales bacterium]
MAANHPAPANAPAMNAFEAARARRLRPADLPHSATSHRFEGHTFGAVDISFFVTDAPAGTGPRLHRHPDAEVFVIEEGAVTFTVGDEAIDAVAGDIVVVPAGCPHKFVNRGPGRARHLDLHASGRMETDWLEA